MAALNLLPTRLRPRTSASDARLIMAVCAPDLAAMAAAVAEGANVDVLDAFGQTPLYLAAERGNTVAVRWLLQHGADPGVANDVGWTPYAAALQNRLYDAADELRDLTISGRPGPTIADRTDSAR
jgi:ankyrin repeat protein